MRRLSLSFLFILAAAVFSYAQAPQTQSVELGISAGGPGWMLGFVGGARSTFSLAGEIKYTPAKWVSIGLTAGVHDRMPGDSYLPEIDEQSDASRYTTYECNLMLMLYGNWLSREKFRLYSGIGYGTMGGYVNGDGRPSHGFQITPVGVSYGKRLFGFAEIGTGWMFCPARAGIGYRF